MRYGAWGQTPRLGSDPGALELVVEAGEEGGDGGAAGGGTPVDVDDGDTRRRQLGGEELEADIHDAQRLIEERDHDPASSVGPSSGRARSAVKRAA